MGGGRAQGIEHRGVVDQDIEVDIPALKLGHGSAYRVLHREIQQQQVNAGRRASCLDLGQDRFPTLPIPAPQDDGRVLLCQGESRRFAQSSRTACHQADVSLHIRWCHLFPPKFSVASSFFVRIATERPMTVDLVFSFTWLATLAHTRPGNPRLRSSLAEYRYRQRLSEPPHC